MLTWKLARVSSIVHSGIYRFMIILSSVLSRGFELPQLPHHSRFSDEAGEGVISTAIVVMIMAFLAVGLWVAFKLIMSHATSTISTQVSQIGQ